ncbi:unnamed protein product [Moneuplotes crassus]|uniref:SUMO-conjugating enzyme UBC9 n=1 Tax=Euplotes crassus TaxID=5936 RepID=A0AAD1Y363_EUPCR|nr:unnamed protein product [Moneuplotes crassus]
MDIGKDRIIMERKNWRKNHPHGFAAKPDKDSSGDLDLYRWRCIIPGPKNTIWEEAFLPLYMEFPDEYPNKPPKCQFKPDFPHPNVYPSGTVCLSILSEDDDWSPSISISTILTGIQDLLGKPNLESPAQLPAFEAYKSNPKKYNDTVREYISKNSEKDKFY